MKQFIFISTLLLLASSLFAQSNDLLVKEIRADYNKIRSNLKSFDTTMIEIWDESAEGGHAIAYYENGKIKLIDVIWLGEMGKTQVEYYFRDEKLIFAFDQDIDYNRPIYWDEKRAKEAGDDEAFDPKKSIVDENRYYFNNGKLFLWLDNDSKEQDLTLGTNILVGQGLIAHCYKMKSKLEK